MKKVAAILLLFSFLSANTVLGEVLKLPLLIHHYIEHTKEDNDNSIIDFLAKHYGKGDEHHHKGGHHEHDNLPFKTINSHSGQVVCFQSLFIDFSKSIDESNRKIPIRQQQNAANTYLDSIWQPPQVS